MENGSNKIKYSVIICMMALLLMACQNRRTQKQPTPQPKTSIEAFFEEFFVDGSTPEEWQIKRLELYSYNGKSYFYVKWKSTSHNTDAENVFVYNSYAESENWINVKGVASELAYVLDAFNLAKENGEKHVFSDEEIKTYTEQRFSKLQNEDVKND